MRAREIQARDAVTLRCLVEDGLREVIAQRSHQPKKKFVPVVAGPRRVDRTMTPAKLNRLIRESNDRPWFIREFGERIASARKRAPVSRKRDRG